MKKTFLYKVILDINGGTDTVYFYGRNKESVRTFCLSNYDCSNVDILKIGESKVTINENVVPFTEEETKEIEQYIANRAMQFIRDKAVLNNQVNWSQDRKAFGFDSIQRKA